MSWFHLWLFLHVTAAIVAFGPTFAFPIIGAVSRKNPAHAPFGLLVSEVIEMRLVIPFALSMPISGLGLAYTVNVEWNHNPWLIAALVVYATAMFVALALQAPVLRKLVQMTSHAGAAAPMPAGPGAAAAGPPPAMAALLKRMQIQGMMLTVFLITIIVLMVWKPGGNI